MSSPQNYLFKELDILRANFYLNMTTKNRFL